MNSEMLIQFAVGGLLTAAAVASHVFASGVLLRLVRRYMKHIHHGRAWYVQLVSVSAFVLGLILLHGAAIVGFAIAYLALGAFAGLEAALYYSSAAYSTLGLTDLAPHEWRLLGAWEGLVGFVLIGWSTALFITVMLRIWSEDHKWFDPRD